MTSVPQVETVGKNLVTRFFKPAIDAFPGAWARMGHSLRSKPSMRLHQHVSSHLWVCQEQHTPWPLERLHNFVMFCGMGRFSKCHAMSNTVFCPVYTVYELYIISSEICIELY